MTYHENDLGFDLTSAKDLYIIRSVAFTVRELSITTVRILKKNRDWTYIWARPTCSEKEQIDI